MNISVSPQDDLDATGGSNAHLGLDDGLEQLVLAMQKNVMNQVPFLTFETLTCCSDSQSSKDSTMLSPITEQNLDHKKTCRWFWRADQSVRRLKGSLQCSRAHTLKF